MGNLAKLFKYDGDPSSMIDQRENINTLIELNSKAYDTKLYSYKDWDVYGSEELNKENKLNFKYGYRGYFLVNQENKQVIIVNSGTKIIEDLRGISNLASENQNNPELTHFTLDLINNIQIMCQRLPFQAKEAQTFAKAVYRLVENKYFKDEMHKVKFICTGHSLGAILADIQKQCISDWLNVACYQREAAFRQINAEMESVSDIQSAVEYEEPAPILKLPNLKTEASHLPDQIRRKPISENTKERVEHSVRTKRVNTGNTAISDNSKSEPISLCEEVKTIGSQNTNLSSRTIASRSNSEQNYVDNLSYKTSESRAEIGSLGNTTINRVGMHNNYEASGRFYCDAATPKRTKSSGSLNKYTSNPSISDKQAEANAVYNQSHSAGINSEKVAATIQASNSFACSSSQIRNNDYEIAKANRSGSAYSSETLPKVGTSFIGASACASSSQKNLKTGEKAKNLGCDYGNTTPRNISGASTSRAFTDYTQVLKFAAEADNVSKKLFFDSFSEEDDSSGTDSYYSAEDGENLSQAVSVTFENPGSLELLEEFLSKYGKSIKDINKNEFIQINSEPNVINAHASQINTPVIIKYKESEFDTEDSRFIIGADTLKSPNIQDTINTHSLIYLQKLMKNPATKIITHGRVPAWKKGDLFCAALTQLINILEYLDDKHHIWKAWNLENNLDRILKSSKPLLLESLKNLENKYDISSKSEQGENYVTDFKREIVKELVNISYVLFKETSKAVSSYIYHKTSSLSFSSLLPPIKIEIQELPSEGNISSDSGVSSNSSEDQYKVIRFAKSCFSSLKSVAEGIANIAVLPMTYSMNLILNQLDRHDEPMGLGSDDNNPEHVPTTLIGENAENSDSE